MSTFKYCPSGHNVTFVENTTLSSPYYFCPECDAIFYPALVPANTDSNLGRLEEMKQLARIVEARKRVTVQDLKTLKLL